MAHFIIELYHAKKSELKLLSNVKRAIYMRFKHTTKA